MSVNLDNVKAIVHNNKNVVKIEDSHGIVWQKPSAGEWHTIWTGDISRSTSTPGETTFLHNYSLGLTGQVQFRVTWTNVSSYSSQSSYSKKHYLRMGTSSTASGTGYYAGSSNSGSYTSAPNPTEFTVDLGDGSSAINYRFIWGPVCELWRNSSYYNYAAYSGIRIYNYTTTGDLTLSTVATTSNSNYNSSSCRITKVEVFY